MDLRGILESAFEGLSDSWKSVLRDSWNKHKECILDSLQKDIETYGETLDIYPMPWANVFKAFTFVELDQVKCIILGQDPYINPGEAMGLAFSVPNGCKMPPSLRNVFKEIERCYGAFRTSTDLTDWAEQGVLLLNTALTVRQGCSASHSAIWKPFMQDAIKEMFDKMHGVVFMLWGNHAGEYAKYVDDKQNLVLKHTHPSPLSRKPFVGCNHFVECNRFLGDKGIQCIVWV